jgi:drug/metabolite transporter (DMT)-like permease
MSRRIAFLDSRAVIVMLLLCAAWGLQSVAIKVAAPELAPVTQSAIRSIGATLLVVVWALVRGVRLFARDGSLPSGIAAGLLFSGEFLLFYWALEYTSASRAILFLYTSPFVVALGVHLLVPGERLSRIQMLGLVCAFSGVALAFGDSLGEGSSTQLLGDTMALAAAVLWGATTVLVRTTRLGTVSAVKSLFYHLAVSALVLPLAAMALGEPWPRPEALSSLTWLSVGYQTVVVAFVTYVIWLWLIGLYPASRLATFSFLTPLLGIVAGALLLDEPLTWGLVAAVALVALGIRLVNRRPRIGA